MKAQNTFSKTLISKIEATLKDWFIKWGADQEEAAGFAAKLAAEVIRRCLDATPTDAPDVLLTDQSKHDSIVFEAKKLAMLLDEKDELFDLLDA